MSDESLIDVSVILVGRDASHFVEGCLKSLEAAVWNDFSHEVIYVDNASKDNTLAMIRDGFPEVKVIANDSNAGFCRAANQGAGISNGRYLLFLNDDTLVVDDAIPLLIKASDSMPDAGTIGSRLLYPDGSEQWSGRKFPSPLNAIFGRRSILSRFFPGAKPVSDYLYKDQLAQHEPFVVDWVSAAAQIVRRDTFVEIGGYAEDYYYWHEAIFCDRIRRAGKQVYLHPLSKIIHFEGKGSGSRPYSVRKWHIVNFHKGAYRCYCEHYNLGRLSLTRWLAACALSTRAAALMAANRITTLGEKT